MLDHLKFFLIINVLAYKKNVNPLLSTTLSGGSFFASPNSTPNFCHTLLSYLSYDKFLAPPHHLINFVLSSPRSAQVFANKKMLSRSLFCLADPAPGYIHT